MNAAIKNKIIVVTGPTATGKSALAVELAHMIGGEVISADSRQTYRGLDIGSAKITQSEMQGIPHHLIDVADPRNAFTVAEFQEMAREKTRSIFSRARVPIICGGTGMYISALIDNHHIPKVPPNEILRKKLELLPATELFEQLKKEDSLRAETIDKNNRPRLIRALEIIKTLGSVPSLKKKSSDYDVLIIGLELPKEELVRRISERIESRIPALFDEIKNLLDRGIPAKRLHGFGLEYKYGLEYIQGTISMEDFKKTLATKTWQFAKRQMTWWKRDAHVMWMDPISDKQKILQLVQDFLKNS